MTTNFPTPPNGPIAASRHRGFTLVELMVAITLGMLIIAALLALYVNVSRTNNEMAKANRMIENGRFAMQLLQSNLVHAGFWGSLRPGPATAIPNACPDAGDWANPAYTANLLAIPVQAFADGSTLGNCGVSGVLANSQVLVVSHANTCVAGAAGCLASGPHLQVSGCTNASPPEKPYLIANAADSSLTLTNRDCATVADRRKIVTSVYYLANSNDGQPTLMRGELGDGTIGASQPLIEGIEALRFELGIDTTIPGDGSPDQYVTCAAGGCDLAQLANVVAVKIHLLARNLETTPGHTDTKSYQVGDLAIAAQGDGFKRHVFTTTVRLVNPSSRREVP